MYLYRLLHNIINIRKIFILKLLYLQISLLNDNSTSESGASRTLTQCAMLPVVYLGLIFVCVCVFSFGVMILFLGV